MKNFKKILALILSLALIASLFVGLGAVTASAATEAAGTVDLLGPGNGIKWYSDTVTKLSDMEGSFKHKFAKKPEVIEGNMNALKRAIQEVKGL